MAFQNNTFFSVKPFSVSRRSLGEKRIPLSAPPHTLRPFRVLVGMDPHHHAQLLLCLPTPEGQDASPAGTAATRDQPDGLPGGLQLPDLPPTAQSEWVNPCVWLCFWTASFSFVGWQSVVLYFSFFDIYCLERGNVSSCTQIRISKLGCRVVKGGDDCLFSAARMLINVLQGFLPSSVMSQKLMVTSAWFESYHEKINTFTWFCIWLWVLGFCLTH